MNKFKAALARFLYGRYGTDQLYNALFLVQIVLLFVAAVLGFLGNVSPVLAIISLILYLVVLAMLVYTMFRFFSRNIAARRRENERYLRLKARLRHPIKSRKTNRPMDTAEHVFRQCPHCKATLRLPRQAGKHSVKCPRCQERFKVRVKKQ